LVPLCGAGLKEEGILSHINECRAALNEFFSTMSPESRERTLMAFGALQKYSVTHRAAQNAEPGPASFIVPRRAHTELGVIMPDLGPASWGYSPFRPYTQAELDQIGQASIGQVLTMLRQKQPMGIDIRMNKIMTEQKVQNPRYAVSWDFDNPQIVCAKHQLLDQRAFLPRLSASCASL
jgi:hypothetical protein